MAQYLPVVVLFALAVLFAAVSFVASKLLAPRKPTVEKFAPYECGILPGREPPERFPVRFYLIAMLFVVFDIEIVFLYPWALEHQALGVFGLLSIVLFSAMVFESFVYLVSQGALDWGPLQVSQRQDGDTAAERTSSSTIRRVGHTGRFVEAIPAEMPSLDDVIDEEELDEEPVKEKVG